MPEKLIRDLIPDLAARQGQPMAVRQAADREMPGLLLAKLDEEAAEVRAADPGRVLEELADVLEVVRALAAWHGCDFGDLREIARAKAEARGGFRQRLVWTAAPAAEEAHPSEERFRAEIHDGGQWMPAGSPTQHRQVALDALAARRAAAKSWAADGEPVRWRVVREATTYTVEDDR